jgi:hypothetical protein
MIPPYVFSIGRITGFAASMAFIVAFAFTIWPGRKRLVAAAIIYVIGILNGMAFRALLIPSFANIVSGLSRMNVSNDATLIKVLGMIWPAWLFIYALSASALLWPQIAQEKALRLGTIVHFAIGLPPALSYGVSNISPVGTAFGVGWLVYALLWFRIRESYSKFAKGN